MESYFILLMDLQHHLCLQTYKQSCRKHMNSLWVLYTIKISTPICAAIQTIKTRLAILNLMKLCIMRSSQRLLCKTTALPLISSNYTSSCYQSKVHHQRRLGILWHVSSNHIVYSRISALANLYPATVWITHSANKVCKKKHK